MLETLFLEREVFVKEVSSYKDVRNADVVKKESKRAGI